MWWGEYGVCMGWGEYGVCMGWGEYGVCMGWGEYGEMVFVWDGVSMVRWCLYGVG